MKPLRVNTLKDDANFLLHFGLAGAATAGVFTLLGAPVVLGGIAVGLTAAMQLGLVPLVKRELQDAIDKEREEHVLENKHHPKMTPGQKAEGYYDTNRQSMVTGWVSRFATVAGLKDVPDVLIMPKRDPVDEQLQEALEHLTGKSKHSGYRGFLRTTFNRHANAFAFQNSHGNVVLNNPLVETLDEQELKGVVAHEIGHLAAGHMDRRMALGWLTGAGMILAGLNKFVTVVISFKNIGLYLLANGLTDATSGAIAKIRGMDLEEDKDKAKMAVWKKYIRSGFVAGLSVAFAAPDMLVAEGISFATREGMNFIQKRYSRRNEFQADRLAAELTGDPEALSSALEKIRRKHLESEPGFNHDKLDAKQKGWLGSLFETVKDASRTHPNVDRRAGRLRSMQFEPAWQP